MPITITIAIYPIQSLTVEIERVKALPFRDIKQLVDEMQHSIARRHTEISTVRKNIDSMKAHTQEHNNRIKVTDTYYGIHLSLLCKPSQPQPETECLYISDGSSLMFNETIQFIDHYAAAVPCCIYSRPEQSVSST